MFCTHCVFACSHGLFRMSWSPVLTLSSTAGQLSVFFPNVHSRNIVLSLSVLSLQTSSVHPLLSSRASFYSTASADLFNAFQKSYNYLRSVDMGEPTFLGQFAEVYTGNFLICIIVLMNCFPDLMWWNSIIYFRSPERAFAAESRKRHVHRA